MLRLGAVLGLLGFLVQMAIVIGDAMTQDTPGRVVLHTADGVEEIDVSEDHINVRASPLPFVETDTQPPGAPIGSPSATSHGRCQQALKSGQVTDIEESRMTASLSTARGACAVG